jgi:hypothetical protein
MHSSFDMIMRRHVMIYDHEQTPFSKWGEGVCIDIIVGNEFPALPVMDRLITIV